MPGYKNKPILGKAYCDYIYILVHDLPPCQIHLLEEQNFFAIEYLK